MRLAACNFLPFLLSFSILLSGCAPKTTAPPNSVAGMPLSGGVHGGQQPVVGAHVYLFAAGTTGYGAASTSLLTSGTVGSDSLGQFVTTDASGSFTITGDYTCASGTQLYVLATQGNPGLPDGQVNPNLALMAAVGQCPAANNIQTTVPFIWVNEVTTIASVYAVSGFMTDLVHVSSSGTTLAQAEIAQAFAAVNNLVNIATGNALATTPAGNGTVPQAEINSLANIIASCVNSNGASSTPCTTLFANAQSGGTHPTDTVTAALYIAQNPATNVSNIFAIPPPTSPFQPALSSAPNDFTIALNFTGGGLSQPFGIGIDGGGNVWTGSSYNPSINEFNGSTGAALSGFGYSGGGVATVQALAIDPSGNAWASSYAIDSGGSFGAVSKFSSAGVPLSPSTGYELPHGTNPSAIAIDGPGNVWLAEPNTSSLFKLNGSTGSFLSPSTGYTGAGLNFPVGIAIDNSGNVWAANRNGNSVSLLNGNTGGAISPSAGYTGGGLNQPDAIAIDNSGNIWVANGAQFNQFGQVVHYGSITELNGATGAAISPSSGYTGDGSLTPVAIAVDGIGNIWVLNNSGAPVCNLPGPPGTTGASSHCSTLTKLNGSTGQVISGSARYTSTSLYQTTAIAIDGAGNIWVTNTFLPGSLTEFVGAAAPVVTPQAVAVANHTIATRP